MRYERHATGLWLPEGHAPAIHLSKKSGLGLRPAGVRGVLGTRRGVGGGARLSRFAVSGRGHTFVFGGGVSASASIVSLDVPAMAANGVAVCTVTIQAIWQSRVDGEYVGVADIAASDIVVLVNGSTTGVTQPTARTNGSGTTTASFTTTTVGENLVTVIILGRLLLVQPTLEGDGEDPGGGGEDTPIFEDNFSNGLKNNANGVTWVNGSGGTPAVVDFDGQKALRHIFGPDAPGQDTTAEQRMDFGRDMSHMCMEYRVHIPSNFAHRNESPNNDKWFMSWRETYSDVTNGTWRCGFEFMTNSSTTPNSFIRGMSSRWDYNSWESSGPNYSPTGQFTPFIGGTGPVQINAWNTIRIEMKAATSSSGTDGIQRMWVNGGTPYFSITTGRFHNYPTGTHPADAWLGWCYFLGAFNSGMLDLTHIHITDVKLYDAKPSTWAVA
jgi:hypothetical protein